MVEERCLAHTGLATQDERSAFTGPHSVDKRIEKVAFGTPADEWPPRLTRTRHS